MGDPPFMPGREVARRLYEEAVRPLMRDSAPGVPYAAALIGPRSNVTGYDTARSMDRHRGPGLTVFLPDDALGEWRARLDAMFLDCLPPEIAGFPTRFREFADDAGIAHMATGEEDDPLLSPERPWAL